MFKVIPILASLVLLVSSANALESLGSFHFQEFVLAPRLLLHEPSQGGFELGSSWISIQWQKQESQSENLDGEIRLGTNSTYQPVIWMTPPTVSSSLTLVEAWAEAFGSWGKLRVGRIGIPDGFESSFGDGFWLMPESEMHKNHWVFGRDEGIIYSAKAKPWLTELSVHNGESGANADNKMWVTGRWQYQNTFSGDGLLITASEGSTNSSSTLGSLAASGQSFHFDPTISAKIRYGTVSLFHLRGRNYWNLEYGRGDILQSEDKFPFAWGRADASWNLGGDLNLLGRYEQTQADLKDKGTIKASTGFGLLVSSHDRLSSLMIFASHKKENPETNNDELIIQFRLNSTTLGE